MNGIKVIKVFASVLCAAFLAFVLFLIIVVLVFIFGQYEDGNADGMHFGASKMRKEAFCYGTENEGDESEFFIPDFFEELPVTKLGGYIGRGFPCPFFIGAPLEEGEYFYSDVQPKPWDEYYRKLFTVHIGKNLKELEFIESSFWAVKDAEGEQDVLFKIVYFFTVDSQNETFYAEDGKLYYKKGNRLAEEFYYE